jgi:D-alanine-D-alanine ligase
MTNKLKVAVMFGGVSTEHEVSVITGIQAIENLDQEKFEAIPIYIGKSGKWFIGDEKLSKIKTYRDLNQIEEKLTTKIISPDPNNNKLINCSDNSRIVTTFLNKISPRPDVVILCFHGGSGENGAVQGFLDMAEIPYTGSGIVGSATGFDKVIMKNIFSDNKIPQTKYVWFFRNEFNQNQASIIKKIETSLKYPLFVKPACSGSSVGVSKAHDKQELIQQIEVACFYDRKIIVEESFDNAKEINISVIGNSGEELECSVCEQVLSSGEVLSYDDKYKGNSDKTGASRGMASTKRIIPAPLKPETVNKIQELAKAAYSSLDCMGLARIDFMVREDTNEMVVLEVNTIPGSMSFYLWEASGLKYKDMVSKLIELALKRKEENQKTVKSFESNILQNFKTGGVKK